MDITQTADGYLGIGTRGGLVRLDGVRFVPFVPPAILWCNFPKRLRMQIFHDRSLK
jgi:hypothetical protein